MARTFEGLSFRELVGAMAGVIVAHPGGAAFVREAVHALEECGLLAGFRTTLARRLRSWSRAGFVLPPGKLRSRPVREAGRAVLARAGLSRAADWAWDRVAHDFSRWSGRELARSSARAIYATEYNALEAFQRAIDLGRARLLEAPCAEHEYVSTLLEAELQRYPQLRDAYHQRVDAHRAPRTLRRRHELALATRVLANSEHTVRSYAAGGVATDRFRIVPLGAPPVRSSPRPGRAPGPLRLVYAGALSITKGVHRLFEALARLPRGEVELDAYGDLQLRPEHVPTRSNVRLHGRVPPEYLRTKMEAADLLVLPSLSDGFGMVVAEAMSLAVPVLATDHVGASALLRDGVSGFVVRAGDTDALLSAIHRAQDKLVELRDMGEAARDAAGRWQWTDFRRAFAGHVREALDAP